VFSQSSTVVVRVSVTVRLAPSSAGDVRLAAVLAMFLGYLGATYAFQGLALGFIMGGVDALLLLITRKATRNTRIAFGPYICIGAMAVVLFGV
jgi:leader peptidase (prepilin peptidase)/N-methyltransferase